MDVRKRRVCQVLGLSSTRLKGTEYYEACYATLYIYPLSVREDGQITKIHLYSNNTYSSILYIYIRVAFLCVLNCLVTFVFLVIYFSVARVLEERIRECHHTNSGSFGRDHDMEAQTMIRGSRCGFLYNHASSVNCC